MTTTTKSLVISSFGKTLVVAIHNQRTKNLIHCISRSLASRQNIEFVLDSHIPAGKIAGRKELLSRSDA
jgi:hypothetical protein